MIKPSVLHFLRSHFFRFCILSLSTGFFLEFSYCLSEFSLEVDHLLLAAEVDAAEGEDDLLGGLPIAIFAI